MVGWWDRERGCGVVSYRDAEPQPLEKKSGATGLKNSSVDERTKSHKFPYR
jgi:hypothetical protein